jgi:hypothetical protein
VADLLVVDAAATGVPAAANAAVVIVVDRAAIVVVTAVAHAVTGGPRVRLRLRSKS